MRSNFRNYGCKTTYKTVRPHPLLAPLLPLLLVPHNPPPTMSLVHNQLNNLPRLCLVAPPTRPPRPPTPLEAVLAKPIPNLQPQPIHSLEGPHLVRPSSSHSSSRTRSVQRERLAHSSHNSSSNHNNRQASLVPPTTHLRLELLHLSLRLVHLVVVSNFCSLSGTSLNKFLAAAAPSAFGAGTNTFGNTQQQPQQPAQSTSIFGAAPANNTSAFGNFGM